MRKNTNFVEFATLASDLSFGKSTLLNDIDFSRRRFEAWISLRFNQLDELSVSDHNLSSLPIEIIICGTPSIIPIVGSILSHKCLFLQKPLNYDTSTKYVNPQYNTYSISNKKINSTSGPVISFTSYNEI